MSLGNLLIGIDPAYARGGSIVARRPITNHEFHALAQEAKRAGPGTAVWERYEEACAEIEQQRVDSIGQQLAEYDRQSDQEVSLHTVERMIRCTVSLTLEECLKPPADAKPDEIEWRLSTACELISLLERIEDFRHDFMLDREKGRYGYEESRLSMLGDLFRDQQRKQAIRMENRQRLDMILPNIFKRFTEDFARARHRERDLRKHIADFQYGADVRYDVRRFDEPISVAFASALALEVHFEDRVFADDVATQGAR